MTAIVALLVSDFFFEKPIDISQGSVATGVNPAGDAGDTFPPIFWLGGTSMRISPILLHTLNLSPQYSPKFAISRSQNKKNFCGGARGNGALPHPQTPPPLELRPPTLNSR